MLLNIISRSFVSLEEHVDQGDQKTRGLGEEEGRGGRGRGKREGKGGKGKGMVRGERGRGRERKGRVGREQCTGDA